MFAAVNIVKENFLLQGSIAYCKAIQNAGLLTITEMTKIVDGLHMVPVAFLRL